MRARIATLSWFFAGFAAASISAGCAAQFSLRECDLRGDCHEDGGDASSLGFEGGREASRSGDAPVCSAPATLDCGGTCVDPTQPAHCGSCTNVCPRPDGGGGHATCANAKCGVSCDPGSPMSLDCNGACVDPTRDSMHCGSCTTACSGPRSMHGAATCAPASDGGGACGVSCASGYHVCAGDCLANSDVPSNSSDPCIVSEAFGIFASPGGNDGNSGTMSSPVATVGHAMDLAKAAGKRVYACGGTYASENLVAGASRDGVNVYSGLDCSAIPWAYNPRRVATLAPTAAGYALQLAGLSAGVTFEDFAFVAQPGSGAGASSIGVFVNNARNATLRRCLVQAGATGPGVDAMQLPQLLAAPSGAPGNAPMRPPLRSGGTGGQGATNPACPTSSGGNGGSASFAAGQSPEGMTGQPGGASNPNGGSSAGCGSMGTRGGSGANGGAGSDGAGSAVWAMLSSSGWMPGGGEAGTEGTAGQGGGGGGSITGVTLGGGGGGGAGGCAGAGGAGGTGGGSSISVLVLQSSVDLESCTMVSGNAGKGGNGAPGQKGQAGGGGGSGDTGACDGGSGGNGGDGGAGGGGAGGLSVGVVWAGNSAMAPTINGISVPNAATLAGVTVGAAGAGGSNGSGNGSGRPGVAVAVVEFQ